MNPKISVIMPCYNNDSFINESINSVYMQTYTNWECIIVNDGSYDKSLTIINNWVQKDNRFRLINQLNQGLSISRNNGSSIATGEYIYFLDADDLLSENSMFELVKISNNADIIIGKTATTNGQNNQIINYLTHFDKTNIKIVDNDNKNILKLVKEKHVNCTAHNKLYKSTFLLENNLQFKDGIYHEDELWFFETMFFCKSIVFSDSITYFYNVSNNNSITKNRKEKNTLDYLFILEFIYKNYYLNLQHSVFKEIISAYLFTFKKNVMFCYSESSKKVRWNVTKQIIKSFNSIQVERNKLIFNQDIENYYYNLYVVSFLKPSFFLSYINSYELTDFKNKTIKKILYKYSYFLNKNKIKKYYKA